MVQRSVPESRSSSASVCDSSYTPAPIFTTMSPCVLSSARTASLAFWMVANGRSADPSPVASSPDTATYNVCATVRSANAASLGSAAPDSAALPISNDTDNMILNTFFIKQSSPIQPPAAWFGWSTNRLPCYYSGRRQPFLPVSGESLPIFLQHWAGCRYPFSGWTRYWAGLLPVMRLNEV